jgi:hypothetical protein
VEELWPVKNKLFQLSSPGSEDGYFVALRRMMNGCRYVAQHELCVTMNHACEVCRPVSEDLSADSVENRENPRSGWSMLRPSFELGTSSYEGTTYEGVLKISQTEWITK